MASYASFPALRHRHRTIPCVRAEGRWSTSPMTVACGRSRSCHSVVAGRHGAGLWSLIGPLSAVERDALVAALRLSPDGSAATSVSRFLG